MPKINITAAVSNAAIPANAARIGLEFCVAYGGQPVRFSPGLTYNSDNSQQIVAGQPRLFTGVLAQGAFSFSGGTVTTVIDTTEYT